MIKMLKDNAVFYGCFLVFLCLGLGMIFVIEKGDTIFFFSENRTPIGDSFFRKFTKVGEEPFYLLFLIIFLFKRFRYAMLIPLLGILVTIFSYGLKSFFAIPRPITYFRMEGKEDMLNLVNGVNLHMGNSSFPSGHTMSGFALFGLVALMMTQKNILGFMFFLITLLIGISRIYLVQHFFVDIYAGAICGVILASLLYWLQSQIPYQPNRWFDKNLLSLKSKTTP